MVGFVGMQFLYFVLSQFFDWDVDCNKYECSQCSKLWEWPEIVEGREERSLFWLASPPSEPGLMRLWYVAIWSMSTIWHSFIGISLIALVCVSVYQRAHVTKSRVISRRPPVSCNGCGADLRLRTDRSICSLLSLRVDGRLVARHPAARVAASAESE